MQQEWRKLDNTAKVFSLANKENTNTFRLSVLLYEKVDSNILKKALTKTLNDNSCYKIRNKAGVFWNYLETNNEEPIIELENTIPCQSINLKQNRGYLFKVTYYKNKINLDVFHILTDGVGAIDLLKSIAINYLDIKYGLSTSNNYISTAVYTEDYYLKYADKTLKDDTKYKQAYLIENKSDSKINKTYHYILKLDELKNICKSYNSTITEYLTAIYIYTMYKSIYDKTSNNDIAITIPIDLRKYYNVSTPTNFFTCMNINGKIDNKENVSLDYLINSINNEFKEKLSKDKVHKYLARDVKLGSNIFIRLVPLCIKKLFMKYMAKIVSSTSTSTLSNIGAIKFPYKYNKYINNVFALVNAGNIQKIKCTICSYENNLNITINSNLIDYEFETEFIKILKEQLKNIKIESNITKE